MSKNETFSMGNLRNEKFPVTVKCPKKQPATGTLIGEGLTTLVILQDFWNRKKKIFLKKIKKFLEEILIIFNKKILPF